VTLAKLFLDPLNNEIDSRGGDPGIGGIEVGTLLQETNVGSERWRRSASWVPSAAWKAPVAADEDSHQALAAAEEPETNFVKRLLDAASVAMASPVAAEAAEHMSGDGASDGVGGEGASDGM